MDAEQSIVMYLSDGTMIVDVDYFFDAQVLPPGYQFVWEALFHVVKAREMHFPDDLLRN